VFAIRGTYHVHDCLTDLVADAASFMDGYTHTGFLLAAQRKLKSLEDLIIKMIFSHPGYRLVVCGHSLGAGVASVFTLLFHKAHPHIPVHCFAYGVPAVFSAEVALSATCKELIDSFVVNDDFAPRLSYLSLSRLKLVVVQLLSQSNTTFQRAFHWISGKNALGETLITKIAAILQCPTRPELQPIDQHIESERSLFPPGCVYHLYQDISVVSSLETHTTITTEKGEKEEEKAKEVNKMVRDMAKIENIEALAVLEDKRDNETNKTKHGAGYVEIPNKETRLEIDLVQTGLLNTGSELIGERKESLNEVTTITAKLPDVNSSTYVNTGTNRDGNNNNSTNNEQNNNKVTAAQTVISKQGKVIQNQGWILEKSNPTLYHEIIISPSMFSDHVASMYEEALDACLEHMQRLEEKSIANNRK